MFQKGISDYKKSELSFLNSLNNYELRKIQDLILDFFNNEPAYRALAGIEDTDLIDKFYQLVKQDEPEKLAKTTKALFNKFKNDLEKLGYVLKIKKDVYRLLEKPQKINLEIL